jgi:glutaredoxin 3
MEEFSMYKVYTMSGCPRCIELKDKLKLNNIEFEEINVEEDFKARAFLISKDLEDMPVLQTDTLTFSGDDIYKELGIESV